MGEQFDKLTTSKRWKRFGLLAVFSLLVIGVFAQCGDSVCAKDREKCIERRANCSLRTDIKASECLRECGDLWFHDSNFDRKTCVEPCFNMAKEERESCHEKYAWPDVPVQVDSPCETDKAACMRLSSACFERARESHDSCSGRCQVLYDHDNLPNVPSMSRVTILRECSGECWTTSEEAMTWCRERYAWQGD